MTSFLIIIFQDKYWMWGQLIVPDKDNILDQFISGQVLVVGATNCRGQRQHF